LTGIILFVPLTKFLKKSKVKIVEMIVQEDKREQIIEIAIKRFSHFGITKTTMNDIADDLALSKQSLYYYFPDKPGLILAVINRVLHEYHARVKELLVGEWLVEDVLLELAGIRCDFAQRYFMLNISEGIIEPRLFDKDMVETLRKFKIEDSRLVLDIFHGASDRSAYLVDELEKQVDLLLNALHGLVCGVMAERNFLPEAELFEVVVQRQRHLIHVFLNGLKYDRHGR
jgi:AcrR family transcriptional regulator